MFRRAIEVWNLHVMAGPVWQKPDGLLAARARPLRPHASPADRIVFAMLNEQRAQRLRLDPRRVGKWSFEPSTTTHGRCDLLCETSLPRKTEPEVPPPIESRVGIGGRWLDEIAMRLTDSSYRTDPVQEHHARLGDDGAVTVHTRWPTVVQLFAMGFLLPVGGAPVELAAHGRTFARMLLTEVRGESGFREDRVVLRFGPAPTGPAGAGSGG